MQEIIGIILGLFLFFCIAVGGFAGAICGLGVLALAAITIGSPKMGFLLVMVIALAFSIGE